MQAGEPSDAQKLQLVIRNCVQKAIELIINSRITPFLPTMQRGGANRWFNLESEELPAVRKELERWRQHVSTPLQLDLFIDSADSPLIREAVSAQPHEPQLVLLESWLLQYEPAATAAENILWPGFYKRFMVLLRALAAYLRLMPAHRFAASLAKLRAAPVLGYRISLPGAAEEAPQPALGFPAVPPPKQHQFTPPDNQHGKLRISVAFRSEAQYSRHAAPQPTTVCCGQPLAGQLIQDYVPFDPSSLPPRRPTDSRRSSAAVPTPAMASLPPESVSASAAAASSAPASAACGFPVGGGCCGCAQRQPPSQAGASSVSAFNADSAGVGLTRTGSGAGVSDAGGGCESTSSPRIRMPEKPGHTREHRSTSSHTTPIGSPELSGASSSNAEVAAALARVSNSPGTPFTPPPTRTRSLQRQQSPTLGVGSPAALPAAPSTPGSGGGGVGAGGGGGGGGGGAASSSSPSPAALAAAERLRLETRRSFNVSKAADELPFLMEEDIREPSLEAVSEAALGSFIEEVQQAPSLKLFDSARKASRSGETSPLARSVDDFSEQLDLIRSRFVESSVGAASSTAPEPEPKLGTLATSAPNTPACASRAARIPPGVAEAVASALPPPACSASSRSSSVNCSLSGSPPQMQPVLLGVSPVATQAQAAVSRPMSMAAYDSSPLQQPQSQPACTPTQADSTEELLARSPPPDDPLFPLAMPPPR